MENVPLDLVRLVGSPIVFVTQILVVSWLSGHFSQVGLQLSDKSLLIDLKMWVAGW